jgi:glycosyltransferase involved in cell wall biosynthesis
VNTEVQKSWRFKMRNGSLVSVVIIFLNAEQYLEEAIGSVLNQTYPHWELLLVDDGSTDASTEIARQYAAQRREQVYYLDHLDHSNRGMGTSRNLGIHHARGDYVAFLDADDLWLPHKLEEQVAILDTYPEAGMLYGETMYWYSWTQSSMDSQRDFVPPLLVQSNPPIPPPKLLPMYLRGKVTVPCPCSILVRRSVALEVGGFDETFFKVQNVYEDQAFYAKVCLKTPVVAVNRCWDWYRQHPQSTMAIAIKTGAELRARHFFLRWLQGYLQEHEVKDVEVWQALHQELWRIEEPAWLPHIPRLHTLIRWVKKWLLRAEAWLLPAPARRWLWARTGSTPIGKERA